MKIYYKVCFSVILLSFLISSGCTTSSEYQTFEDQVKETVSNMITLLEQGNYYDLVRDYADPEFVKEEGGVEAVLRDFSEDDKENLLKYLKDIQEILPTVDRKNLTVTYMAEDFPQALVFKKIGGRWYLTND
ncbi:MAG: hypothetical protein ISS16_02545 [Ignavibacteria bacterium]|nr:hypothetical protein [Ignavibacteria bacterium]